MRTYLLYEKTSAGWKKVSIISATNIEAAKKQGDEYAFSRGISDNEVGVEEVATPKAPAPFALVPFALVPRAPAPRAPVPKAPAPKAPVPKTPVPRLTDVGINPASLVTVGSRGIEAAAILEKMNKTYPVMNGKTIGFGQTIENKYIRASRWSSAIKVVDLKNAGRRGMKVDMFSLYDLDRIGDKQPTSTNVYNFECSLPKLDYETARIWAKAIYAESARFTRQRIGLETSTEKGVDVAPPGFEKITINAAHFTITADERGFSISDLDDPANEPRAISLDKHGKKNVKRFYEWAYKNKDSLAGKTFSNVLHMMSDEKIKYHYYFGMD